MEEFIKNFNEFRNWLYEKEKETYDDGKDSECLVYEKVIKKFKELNLDDAF